MNQTLLKFLKTIRKPILHFVNFVRYTTNNVWFCLSGKKKRNLSFLQSLKDKHRGRRCFIVCNGPSLLAEDLTKIHDNGDLSIGMNMIARVYPNTPWRPDFLSATDDCVFNKKSRELVEKCEAGLKLYDQTRYFRTGHVLGKVAYLRFNESKSLLDSPVFDPDITQKMPSIGTSAYSMIEFAVYLGCKQIYIIGCDMSFAVNQRRDGSIYYNESGRNHFYGKDVDTLSHIKPNPTWQLEVAFDAAEKYSKEYGVKIYNATRGGNLEAFERVEFDSLF